MKISQKKRDELYAAIHEELMTVRIKLKLSSKDDVTLAQVEHSIWAKQKRALGLSVRSAEQSLRSCPGRVLKVVDRDFPKWCPLNERGRRAR